MSDWQLCAVKIDRHLERQTSPGYRPNPGRFQLPQRLFSVELVLTENRAPCLLRRLADIEIRVGIEQGLEGFQRFRRF